MKKALEQKSNAGEKPPPPPLIRKDDTSAKGMLYCVLLLIVKAIGDISLHGDGCAETELSNLGLIINSIANFPVTTSFR